MKKLLIFLGLIVSLFSYGQGDSIQIASQTIDNTSPDNAFSWYYYISGTDTLINRFEAPHFQPFFFTSPNVYPRSAANNLTIGSTTNSSGYKLNVIGGDGYFSNNLRLNSRLIFSNASIWTSGTELYFNDAIAGTASLSDLLSGSAYTVGNGVKSTAGIIGLGNSLTENTTIDIDNYSFNVGNGTSTYLDLNNATGLSSLVSSNRLTLQSSDITLYAVGGFRLYSNGTTCATFHDYTTTPYGLIMPDWSTYNTNILNDTVDGAIMTFGATKAWVAAHGGTGSFGATENSVEVMADNNKQIMAFTQDGDHYTLIGLEADTITIITTNTTSVNVTSSKRIQVTGTGEITIQGFSGAVQGDEIHIANTTTNNLILKNNGTGTQKIQNGSDVTITGYGGAWLYFDGTKLVITALNQ
jgi:hypothetical protein